MHVRARPSGGAVSVTAALVNERPHDAAGRHDSNLYQSSLSASLGEDEEFVKSQHLRELGITKRGITSSYSSMSRNLQLGTESTSWSLNEGGSCKNVSTDWIPQSEVFKASAAITTSTMTKFLNSSFSVTPITN